MVLLMLLYLSYKLVYLAVLTLARSLLKKLISTFVKPLLFIGLYYFVMVLSVFLPILTVFTEPSSSSERAWPNDSK